MKNIILDILNGIRPEFDFTQSRDYIKDGMLDSFDIVTLVTEIEDKFNITIDGEDIVPENFSNVQTICSLVERSEKI